MLPYLVVELSPSAEIWCVHVTSINDGAQILTLLGIHNNRNFLALQRTSGVLERNGGARDRTGGALQRTGGALDRTGVALQRTDVT